MTFPYPTGGWDVSSISPSDAVLTLRGLGRRLTEAVAKLGNGGADRAGALIAGADASMRQLGQASETVRVHDDPAVTVPQPDAVGPSGSPQSAIDHLVTTASSMAVGVEHATNAEWTRTGRITDGPGAGREISALDLLRAAVFVGVTALRGVEALADNSDDE
jgi:hypothetical protein